MAKKKIRTPGISYFGRKVETQEIRFDKNVFFEKQKSSDSNIVTTPATLFDGRQFREVKGRRVVVLPDADQSPISNDSLFSAGILPMTPTSPRGIQVPTASDFISNVLFELFSAFDFTVINLASAGSGPIITVTVNTDVDIAGSPVISPGTSGTFRAIRTSNTEVDIFRL
tara:strand:- start:452 stop:961 length:510 start_codon:yes stop_codon:yes gene_type:complete